MEATFNINKSSRNIVLTFLENHSLEKLNTIPEGFNNNLIWNIGHIIVVQQMLVYKLSGLPMMISDEMVEHYKKGTKPEHNVEQRQVDEIKALLFSTLEQTKKDFSENVFQNYAEFTTGTGYYLSSAKEAIEFNNFHEALHIGFMMQIKKFI
ncbi:DinB family protein [Flavobacterium sp.]|uniref:DinB family protein n=1 Tax=Flavobacterium sp. TaxID=239 RepID=UPI002487D334|nr:DinB family protein [Flavobacterium sp.]MDI1316838.1 DinB family protein [Flavobacterium sp.]